MKVAPRQQMVDSDCGPTCIHMISDYFGKQVSYAEILSACHFDPKEGLSNADLVLALSQLGFTVSTRSNTSWDVLRHYNNRPELLVVSWMRDGYVGHFSLVERVTKNHITLNDPEKGQYVRYGKIRFMRLWMDYDDLWYPLINTDITLRWLAIVSNTPSSSLHFA